MPPVIIPVIIECVGSVSLMNLLKRDTLHLKALEKKMDINSIESNINE